MALEAKEGGISSKCPPFCQLEASRDSYPPPVLRTSRYGNCGIRSGVSHHPNSANMGPLVPAPRGFRHHICGSSTS